MTNPQPPPTGRDGATWQEITPLGPEKPAAGAVYQFDYDAHRDVFVLYGGIADGAWLNETWELVPACYADCDQSTGVGVLDIFDFLCFQESFVNGGVHGYACECDTSAQFPVCDIFDFLCFQNAFVAGCP